MNAFTTVFSSRTRQMNMMMIGDGQERMAAICGNHQPQVHDAVHHEHEGGDEEHQDDLLAQAEAFCMGRGGLAALNAEQLRELARGPRRCS